MITLKVADYCHGCSEFEPHVDRTTFYSDDFFGGREVDLQTVVTCVHERRCQSIKAYIEDQSKEKAMKGDIK